MEDFYASYLGIPVAGASLPIAAFFFLGIYGCNVLLLIAVIILGIGHIGIHVNHQKELVHSLIRRKLGFRILKLSLCFVFVVLFCGLTVVIGVRNYNGIKGCVHNHNGIDEDGYLEIGGQKQYYLIRGEDINNPVIIWIHGGPASPDTMLTYGFTNYLKHDFTIIAWNQRGCGRTYFKNRKSDPSNKTATFKQAQEDLDELVDYACNRFKQNKVIIAGHSYGTMVGSKYSIDHSDKVAAYVGVGQMGANGSDIYAYEDALSIAKKMGMILKQWSKLMRSIKLNRV